MKLRSTSKLWCGVRFSLVSVSLFDDDYKLHNIFLTNLTLPSFSCCTILLHSQQFECVWILQLLQVQTVCKVSEASSVLSPMDAFNIIYIYIFFFSIFCIVQSVRFHCTLALRLNFWGLSSSENLLNPCKSLSTLKVYFLTLKYELHISIFTEYKLLSKLQVIEKYR